MKRRKVKKINYINFIKDKNMREAIIQCNRYGVTVNSYFHSVEFSEKSCVDLKIMKGNEGRIYSILEELKRNKCLDIMLFYDEFRKLDALRIYGSVFNKSKVFTIVRKAVKRKTTISRMSLELQEIYKMHKIMKDEDMEHELLYRNLGCFRFFTMRNVENTYFRFGLDRVKKIFDSLLFRTIDSKRNECYNYKFILESSMLNKLKNINLILEEEFKWQADEFELLCDKYRRTAGNEEVDMFARLAKVRDEYDITNHS